MTVTQVRRSTIDSIIYYYEYCNAVHRHTLVHVFGQRITAVQLDEIHVPFGERERVQLERSQDSRISGTREVTVVLVDTELQSPRVDLYGRNKRNIF